MAVIFTWISAIHYHIGSQGNYEMWITNPIHIIPIAHALYDPHSALSSITSNISHSGIYNVLYTLGFTSVTHIYNMLIMSELLALASISLAIINTISFDSMFMKIKEIDAQSFSWPYKLLLICLDLAKQRLTYHGAILVGVSSLLWSGHLEHVSLTAARSISSVFYPHEAVVKGLYTGNWKAIETSIDLDTNIYSCATGAGNSIITFFGSLKPDTMSLYLSDLVHHHLAVGVLIIILSHLYSLLSISRIATLPFRSISISLSNEQLSLSISCSILAILSSIVAINGTLFPSYVYLSYDYVTVVSLYVHHQYIACFLMLSSMVHAILFLITNVSASYVSLRIQASFTSHLSWVTLYLGFHTLGVYIHNDSVVAFGLPLSQILIDPLVANHQMFISTLPYLGPADLLAHHSISLGLHVTALILCKGAQDASGSRLVPDKIHMGFSFACDGPTRGGTCDVTAFDSVYLASFWMLNTHSWITFYYHWKHLSLFSDSVNVSATYLNGWFRDYLFYHSASLINGYNAFGSNDLAVLSWLFLYGHLAWATGFMFLISWRGYWQEIVEIIFVLHLKTPVVYDLWPGSIGVYSPVALSIVQARVIGLVHFSVGFVLTYAAFVLASTS